jgi:phosphoribosylamine--glycine ligase
MKILVIGSGGREQALAWKLLQGHGVTQVLLAPGNGGTAALGRRAENRDVSAEDVVGLVSLARAERVDLVVVGPEVALSLGVVDQLRSKGVAAFGPTQAAAQIESSKTFAKDFMRRHSIPTARYAVFTEHAAALAHLHTAPYPVVIKADGLAAGKGVLIPSDLVEAEAALRNIMVERAFGEAGASVVIEERLSGPEVSLLAFSDGHAVSVMPAAQDHKRVGDGDLGPNTGGMGAFAPSPLANASFVAEATRTILQPTIDGLRTEGTPFVGVLYAGLMLTADGARVLEFNCRFGDPETQALLLLLESDLVEIMQACLNGKLAQTPVAWRTGAAATIALTSGGYPGHYERGHQISGLAEAQALDDVVVFHAGTKRTGGDVLTNGGRVLNVSAWGTTLPAALARAYAAVDKIHFSAMHYRRDIGGKR